MVEAAKPEKKPESSKDTQTSKGQPGWDKPIREWEDEVLDQGAAYFAEREARNGRAALR
jgi:hypothetical protein